MKSEVSRPDALEVAALFVLPDIPSHSGQAQKIQKGSLFLTFHQTATVWSLRQGSNGLALVLAPPIPAGRMSDIFNWLDVQLGFRTLAAQRLNGTGVSG